MAPNSRASQRPAPSGQRPVPLTKMKGTMPLGPTTLAFFRRGEELEASQWRSLPHDDPALVPRKLGFRSFDRVPRNRAPLLITLLVIASACVGVLGWPRLRAATVEAATTLQAKLSVQWVRLKQLIDSRHDAE